MNTHKPTTAGIGVHRSTKRRCVGSCAFSSRVLHAIQQRVIATCRARRRHTFRRGRHGRDVVGHTVDGALWVVPAVLCRCYCQKYTSCTATHINEHKLMHHCISGLQYFKYKRMPHKASQINTRKRMTSSPNLRLGLTTFFGSVIGPFLRHTFTILELREQCVAPLAFCAQIHAAHAPKSGHVCAAPANDNV